MQFNVEVEMNRKPQMIALQLAWISIFIASVCRAQDAVNQEIGPEAKAAIEAVQAAGGQALRIAANSMDYEVSFHLSGKPVTDDCLEPLRSIPNLVWLNLSNTNITNDGLKQLSALPLTRLHLEKTRIGDAGLEYLKDLANLEYLNLYATQVTDAGLEHLAGLKQLKRLYVWQSGVTDEGIRKLNESLPELVIVGEIKMTEPAVAAEPAAGQEGAESQQPDAEKTPATVDEAKGTGDVPESADKAKDHGGKKGA
jgi:hypothetical protein